MKKVLDVVPVINPVYQEKALNRSESINDNVENVGIKITNKNKAVTTLEALFPVDGSGSPTTVISADITIYSPVSGPIYFVAKDANANYRGLIGTLDPSGMELNTAYQVPYKAAHYVPFATIPPAINSGSDIENNLANYTDMLPEGQYYTEILAFDSQNNKYTSEDTFYVDNTYPEITYDEVCKPGVYEVDSTQVDEAGAVFYITGTIYDKTLDLMQQNNEVIYYNGEYVEASQAFNIVYATIIKNSFPYDNPIEVNADGSFSIGITPTYINADFIEVRYGDYADISDVSTTTDRYYFIEKGTEYVSSKAEKMTPDDDLELSLDLPDNSIAMSQGDQFKYTIQVHNGQAVTSQEHNIGSVLSDFMDMLSVELNPEYVAYLNANQVPLPELTYVLDYSSLVINITFPENVTKGIDGNMNVIDITFECKNDYANTSKVTPLLFSANLSHLNEENSLQVRAGVESVVYLISDTSIMKLDVPMEAFVVNDVPTVITFDTGVEAKFTNLDTSEVIELSEGDDPYENGILHTGTTFISSPVLPINKNGYFIEVTMPGHFTSYYTFNPAIDRYGLGQPTGDYRYIDMPSMYAGDINGDGVIDINDAIAFGYALEKWVNNPTDYTRSADLNYDGKISVEDWEYIEENMGQVNYCNPDYENLPTPQYTTTEDITLFGTVIPAGSDIADIEYVLKDYYGFKTPPEITGIYSENRFDVNLYSASGVFVIEHEFLIGGGDNNVETVKPWTEAITEVTIDGVNMIESQDYYFDTTNYRAMYFKGTSLVQFEPTDGKNSDSHLLSIKAEGYEDLVVPITISIKITSSSMPYLLDVTIDCNEGDDATIYYMYSSSGYDWWNGNTAPHTPSNPDQMNPNGYYDFNYTLTIYVDDVDVTNQCEISPERNYAMDLYDPNGYIEGQPVAPTPSPVPGFILKGSYRFNTITIPAAVFGVNSSGRHLVEIDCEDNHTAGPEIANELAVLVTINDVPTPAVIKN